MNIRHYTTQDCAEVMTLFHRTVHTINSKDYTTEQLRVWAPNEMDEHKWNERLLQHYSVVGEIEGTIVAFAAVDSFGYIDLLYVHQNYQRQKIASRLVLHLEIYSRSLGIRLMTTAASITARPFFEQCGYTVIQQQSVEKSGQWLTNFVMEKIL